MQTDASMDGTEPASLTPSLETAKLKLNQKHFFTLSVK